MGVLEYIMIILLLLAAFMIVVRIRLGVSEKKEKERKDRGCESGASKTIGDRELQEDEYGITESVEGILAVLADGAGKQYGGKLAARLAVQVFLDMFEDRNAFYNPHYYFRKAFQGANREILNGLEENQGSAAVGAALVKNRRLYYAVAGNVKIAVYRNHELVPVSAGHTINVFARQKYMEGKLSKEEAVMLLEKHRLYNYVGQDGFQNIEFFDTPIVLYGGEHVLLMSDGLYETVKWKDVEDCLEEGTCQEKAFRIIELVNQSKEKYRDNASVVVLKVK